MRVPFRVRAVAQDESAPDGPGSPRSGMGVGTAATLGRTASVARKSVSPVGSPSGYACRRDFSGPGPQRIAGGG